MGPKAYGVVTGILFSLGAVAHLTRLITGWHLTLGNTTLPVWISWIGLAVGAYLGFEGFRLSRFEQAEDARG